MRQRDLEFGNRLKRLMEAKGFPADGRKTLSFAQAIGKAPPTVYSWVNGRIPTLRGDIELLTKFFGVTADYLLLGKTQGNTIDNLDFPGRLKALMNSKGIKNNNRLAQAIGRPAPVTRRWLKGTVPTQPEDWKLLCDFFGVSADYLLLGRGDKPVERVVKIKIEVVAPKGIEVVTG